VDRSQDTRPILADRAQLPQPPPRISLRSRRLTWSLRCIRHRCRVHAEDYRHVHRQNYSLVKPSSVHGCEQDTWRTGAKGGAALDRQRESYAMTQGMPMASDHANIASEDVLAWM
jgi:hypothetical protein